MVDNREQLKTQTRAGNHRGTYLAKNAVGDSLGSDENNQSEREPRLEPNRKPTKQNNHGNGIQTEICE